MTRRRGEKERICVLCSLAVPLAVSELQGGVLHELLAVQNEREPRGREQRILGKWLLSQRSHISHAILDSVAFTASRQQSRLQDYGRLVMTTIETKNGFSTLSDSH